MRGFFKKIFEPSNCRTIKIILHDSDCMTLIGEAFSSGELITPHNSIGKRGSGISMRLEDQAHFLTLGSKLTLVRSLKQSTQTTFHMPCSLAVEPPTLPRQNTNYDIQQPLTPKSQELQIAKDSNSQKPRPNSQYTIRKPYLSHIRPQTKSI